MTQPSHYYVVQDKRHVELGTLVACDHCGTRAAINTVTYVLDDTSILKEVSEVRLPHGKTRRLGIPLRKSPPQIFRYNDDMSLCEGCLDRVSSKERAS